VSAIAKRSGTKVILLGKIRIPKTWDPAKEKTEEGKSSLRQLT
jgi:hypothetical protein